MSTTNNGLVFNGQYYMPPEILSLILSYVDEESLCKHCTLVCPLWSTIIKEFVWKMKFDRLSNKATTRNACKRFTADRRKQLDAKLFQINYPHKLYKMVCSEKNPLYRNVVKNPCGQQGFQHWMVTKNGGDEMIVEDLTGHDEEVVNDVTGVLVNDEMRAENVTKCFTTSFEVSSKMQLIDLYAEGVPREYLDEYQPPIYISEWHGSRRDCSSTYHLRVILMDRFLVEITNTCQCNFFYAYKVKQWEGGFFKKKEHLFKNYGREVRYVLFDHVGRDDRFWTGHYGSKFTMATVKVLYPHDDLSIDVIVEPENRTTNNHHAKCPTDPPPPDYEDTLQVVCLCDYSYQFDKPDLLALLKYRKEHRISYRNGMYFDDGRDTWS